MKNMSYLLAAACAAFFLSSPLLADSVERGRAETVNFADLDMGRDADAVILYQRIRQAAARVCSNLDSTTLYMQHVYAECQVLAIENAVARVNRPLLSSYSQTQLGTQKRIRLASFGRFF